MAKKDKKSKKADEDAMWEKRESSKSGPAVAGAGGDSDEEVPVVTQQSRFTFADLGDDNAENQDDDDSDGGLMALAARSKKKTKAKKSKQAEIEEIKLEDKAPVEVSMDDFNEDDFGPVKKQKKPKKGKKAKDESEDEDDFLAKAAAENLRIAEEKKAQAQAEQKQETPEPEDQPTGVLSKKEKERLKKEKEKAKKKAQAAAKKTQSAKEGTPSEAPSEPVEADQSAEIKPEPVPEQADDDADDGEAASSSKNKKKKKKKGGAAEKEEAPAAPAKGKKVGANVAALRLLMEQKRAAEEEARRLEEEERLRIEREEQERLEAERLKEEAKQKKKEKEKAKKEQLRKEGKLLTPKQKAEAAAAAARREAMLASGMIVEGLTGAADADKPRKVTYGKKRPAKKNAKETPSAPESPKIEQAEETATPAVSEPVSIEKEEANGVKDEWDASSADEAPKEDVKDDWDASSEDEAPPAKPAAKPAPTEISNGKPPVAQAKSAPPAKPVTKAAPPAKKPAQEESSDESSDEDSDSDDDSDEDDSSDDDLTAQEQAALRREEAARKRQARLQEAVKAGDKNDLRSPICVILGHVDTGKTKLLDKIRQTNVQEGEAGGITQQIGATYFPMEAIKRKTAVLENNLSEFKLPGLLVIDTPGHESFSNLRSRGSSLCNIAILVVDIMHGLEPQTIESLKLLRDRKTPFIVALNKIDRLYGWQATPDNGFQESLAKQSRSVQNEFEKRLKDTQLAFAEQGLNALPYYENKNFAKYVSLVPTSAHTGEGVPDMLMLVVKLTQERMSDRLMYISELECTVLEVKVIEGLGTTIDVVLCNGILREGDRIVVCGLNGPIVTQVRALLTPQPLKELRVKGSYVHHKEVKASLGIKICAPDLEKAIAGSRLLLVGPDDDEDDLKEEVMEDLQNLLGSVDRTGKGVYVQASTLGSLEALLDFLKTSKIPVAGINIGPVHKKDITRSAVMLERAPEFAVILAFDVPVDKEAAAMAEELKIKIFTADIIYHLFDAFTKYTNDIMEAKRKDSAPKAVWPCVLKIIACFAKRDPIIVGCDILEGSLRIGTPICVVKTDPETRKKEVIPLGRVSGLEINHKTMTEVKKSQAGGGVAVKIEHAVYEAGKMYGRHFDDKDELISQISRESIDTLKNVFRNDVAKEDWLLIKKLKSQLDIP